MDGGERGRDAARTGRRKLHSPARRTDAALDVVVAFIFAAGSAPVALAFFPALPTVSTLAAAFLAAFFPATSGNATAGDGHRESDSREPKHATTGVLSHGG